MTNLQIGAQLYSVRDHCQDPAEMLKCMKEIKAIGYNICQLSGHNKEFTAEQAEFNRLAPYLMTSVDSEPALATRVRRAVMEKLDKGEWLLIGGHGAAMRVTC